MLAVGKWSPDEQALRSGLQRICDKAMDCWALAQQLEDRIWPDFSFELSEDWQPLPIPRTCTILRINEIREEERIVLIEFAVNWDRQRRPNRVVMMRRRTRVLMLLCIRRRHVINQLIRIRT